MQGQNLLKATRPEDFKAVAKAVSPAGAALVDHRPHVTPLPAHAAEVEHYRKTILAPGVKAKRLTNKGAGTTSGVTKKQVYEAAGPEPRRYMIKPYHEAPIKRTSTWVQHPHQGWAEMANQALYHAGGIGHLHQTVHVDEHDMGPGKEREPALVVHLAHGMKPVAEANAPYGYPPQTYADLRKIGLMDFLTSNQDRHGGNLMVGKETTDPRILAVDHSRSFQYLRPFSHKWDNKTSFKNTVAYARRGGGDLNETLAPYIGHATATSYAGPPGYNGATRHMNPDNLVNVRSNEGADWVIDQWRPAFEWWEKASPHVREEMDRQLGQIKDPKVRAHIKRNFDARATVLDQMARDGHENYGHSDWSRSAFAPVYLPGEKSDEERQEEQYRQEAAE